MVQFYLRPSRAGDNRNPTFRLWKNLKAVENVQGWNERQKDKGKSGKASQRRMKAPGRPELQRDVAGEFLGTTLLFGKLYAWNVDLLDCRRFGEKLASLRHERLGDGTVEMSLASAFVGEGVEYAANFPDDAEFIPADKCAGGGIVASEALGSAEEMRYST